MIKKLFILLLAFTLLLGAIPIMPAHRAMAREEAPVQREFPSLHITSDLNPFIQEREFWHPGSVAVTSENEDWAFEEVDVRLRGRGNSTWWGAPDKRPLRIRFETPQPMFGSDYAHRDWILLANAFDNSLLRTHFALYFSRLMGNTGFVPSSQFLHLYVNGVYMGVYQFTDERDIGPGRGEVVIDPDPTISEYWLEMDYRTQDYFNVNGLWYDMRFPSGNALTDEHIDYAHQFMENVSQAIRSHDWGRVQAIVDIPSMVDYYILQELVKDIDVSFSSMFMQIRGQGDERRLYQGPVWDFDLTMGNARQHSPVDDRPSGIWAARRHYWFGNLMQIPEFRDIVVERWNDVMAYELPRAIESISYMATHYRDAFERNFEANPVLGVRWGLFPSPARYEIDTFIGQAAFLIDFLNTRAAWLDNHFNSDDISAPLPLFDDVAPGAWYHDAVEFVYENELMTGFGTAIFNPQGLLNRAMMATILWRMAGEPEAEWSPIFTDVPANAPRWYRTSIMWAESTGVVTGHNGRFNPYGHITREEMAAMLYRYTELILEGDLDVPEAFNLDHFRDEHRISDWAQDYIRWANYNELIRGLNATTLSPQGNTTRAQCAMILMRFMREFAAQISGLQYRG